MKKIILPFSFFIITIFGVYLIISLSIYSKLTSTDMDNKEITGIKIESNNNIIFLKYINPKFSFGSGHKFLFIFSKNKFLLGYRKFGEFPCKILNVDENQITIEINDSSNVDYIKQWTVKNKRIWKYKINYLFNLQ